MIAVILAGGKGERLKHLTEYIPKPMIQIEGMPVLERQINLLRQYKITDIHILTGYLGYVISNYFGDGKILGVNIKYFPEDKPLGTSGCIKELEGNIQDDFLVVYGDLMLNMKLDNFIAFHKRKGGTATLVVHPNDHPCDSDLVVMDDSNNKIIDFLTKDKKPLYYANLVNAAVYILSPVVFGYIPEGIQSDFVRDVFPEMLRCSEKIYGYKTVEYIKDMGTVDRFEKVNKNFISGKIQSCSKENKRPAIFMDRDGTLVMDIALLHKLEDLEIYPFSAHAIKKIDESEYLSFLITNQPAVAHNMCNIEEVKHIHNKLETLLGYKQAYLDDIYFCPHHPDKGYPEEKKDYKVDCNCRKPKVGMIENAVKEYNVDVKSSWFIGDTTTDIQTGINAGLQTILVRTGRGGKDRKYECIPDFVFDNLEKAIDFILEDKYKYEKYIKKIIGNIKKNKNNSPIIIRVGGLARSGKSTFVKLLTKKLQKSGIMTQILSLDNWIVALDDRTDKMTVRERYKYDVILRDITRLINGENILLKKYESYSRKIVDEKYFSLDGSRCLVIDGVPALNIEGLRNISKIKVYIEVNEDIRRERFFSFYRWKGLPDKVIEHLYQKRLNDEVPFIKESKKHANIIVKV